MTFFRKIGRKLKELSPATIREIIVVIVILCLSIVLSLPQYHEDLEAKRAWDRMENNHERADQ